MHTTNEPGAARCAQHAHIEPLGCFKSLCAAQKTLELIGVEPQPAPGAIDHRAARRVKAEDLAASTVANAHVAVRLN